MVDLILRVDSMPLRPKQSMLQHMEKAIEKGARVLWDYKGLVRELPKEVVLNVIQLAKDYEARQPNVIMDRAPKFGVVFTWEQTVPLSDKGLDQGTEAATDNGTRPE